jgi:hypothetical protein
MADFVASTRSRRRQPRISRFRWIPAGYQLDAHDLMRLHAGAAAGVDHEARRCESCAGPRCEFLQRAVSLLPFQGPWREQELRTRARTRRRCSGWDCWLAVGLVGSAKPRQGVGCRRSVFLPVASSIVWQLSGYMLADADAGSPAHQEKVIDPRCQVRRSGGHRRDRSSPWQLWRGNVGAGGLASRPVGLRHDACGIRTVPAGC